jgi:hypothetical protein
VAAALEPGRFLSVESSAVISFEPTAPELIATRAELRSILATMTADADQLLHGVIEGTAATATDLDNALLYNIGGKVANATRYGVCLERGPHVTDVPARYRYRLVDRTQVAMPSGATDVAHLDQVPLSGPPGTWAHIWAAVRPSPHVTVAGDGQSGAIFLDLRLDAPGFVGCANGGLVKTIIDGVLTALHVHRDRGAIGEISRRLAMKAGLLPNSIRDLLLDDSSAVLGPRDRLIAPRASGIQCSPDDLRVAWVRITINRSSKAWALNGRVAASARDPATA